MSLRIHTNVASLMTQRNLQTVTGRLQETFGRLSSGLRINSAADDASGLGISMQMRAQMRSMTAAARNTQDGISLAQVAEGALHQMSDIFIRLKELGILAQNGTYTQEDREIMDAEYLGLVDELQRIANETEFNGLSLFTTGNDVEIQVGTGDGDTISIELSDLTQFPQFLASFPLSGPIGPDLPVSLMGFMIDSISQVRGEFGSVMNRLEDKGLLRSEMGGSSKTRGGRRKRIYYLTSSGKTTLDEVRSVREKLYNQLSPSGSYQFST